MPSMDWSSDQMIDISIKWSVVGGKYSLFLSCSLLLQPANFATACCQVSSSHKWTSIRSQSQALKCVSRKCYAQSKALNPLKCSQFKINLKDVTEAYGHHKHNMEEHLFPDGTLPLLSVCLLWRLATHWWGIRKSLRNTNSRMAQSQPTPDYMCVFIYRLMGKD